MHISVNMYVTSTLEHTLTLSKILYFYTPCLQVILASLKSSIIRILVLSIIPFFVSFYSNISCKTLNAFRFVFTETMPANSMEGSFMLILLTT